MPTRCGDANCPTVRWYTCCMAPDLPQDSTRRPPATPLERIVTGLDNALRTLATPAPQAARPSPASGSDEARMSDDERRHAAGLMRINHAGEVAAQGLYQGHALVSRSPLLHRQLQHAADEEYDHLAWCRERLEELGAGRSKLDPVWYAGAYVIGAVSALAGDRWGLGFIDETERQVAGHLEDHLGRLPPRDTRSRKVLGQMKAEEEQHGANARDAGAAEMPAPVRGLMRVAAGVMKAAAYRV